MTERAEITAFLANIVSFKGSLLTKENKIKSKNKTLQMAQKPPKTLEFLIF
jgi:hypothetical protein